MVLVVKNTPANAGDTEMWVRSLGQEDLLEKGIVTHSSILAWRIPCTEEPGGLQSVGSQRVGQDCSNLACTHKGIKHFILGFPTDYLFHKNLPSSELD